MLRVLENADQMYDMYENLPDDKIIIDKNTLQLLLKLLRRLHDDELSAQKIRGDVSLFNDFDFKERG